METPEAHLHFALQQNWSDSFMTNSTSAALAASPDSAIAVPEERTLPVWGAVASLGLGVFGMVTAEFLPASLLTPIAQDLNISEGAAGQAVTATAIVGAFAAIAVPILTNRIDRKLLMWGLTITLIASSLLTAFANSLPALLAARVLLGIGLSGFWAVSGAMTMRLVPARLLPRAMSIVLTGVSVATVCAAPVGAYIGDVWGWRTAFLLSAAIGAVTLLVQLVTIPSLPPVGSASLRTLADVASRRLIRVGLVLTLLVASAHFAAFTYVRPFLEKVPAFDIQAISLTLLAFGVAGFFGTLVAGFVAERSLKVAAAAAPLLVGVATLALLVFGVSGTAAVVAVAAWGFGFGIVPVAIQTWLLRAAPDQAESAGGLMVVGFQTAIAVGAIVGGLLVDHVGVTSAFAYSAIAALTGCLVVLVYGPRAKA
jgi:DHA1 family purine ribonucleoside efflux pump-like MFS transporter